MVNKSDPIVIQDLQKEVALWAEQEKPQRIEKEHRENSLYKIVDAFGAVAAVFAKLHKQKTSVTYDPGVLKKEIKKNIGMIIIHLMDFCSRQGWSFQDIVDEVWEEMKGEDFKKYPGVGRPRGS